jgi:uncharacterized protein YndB with AHSA1/START domain
LNDAAVVIRRVFPASRERLFRAWTDPVELMGWFSPAGYRNASAETEVRVGGRYRISMQKLPDGVPFYASGEYRTVEFPSRLVFSWTWEDPAENVRDSIVTVELVERGDGTEVVLTHELVPLEKQESHAHGWRSILAKLAERIEAQEKEMH